VPADEGPALTSVLRGRLIELGTRAPVSGATVSALAAGRRYSIDADERGHFRLPLPPGPAEVAVNAPSHNPFIQRETLLEHQELVVSYLVERDRYDPYEIVVVDEQRREEVSRISLRGAEIKQIPGTFGDPFRVVQTLPGVASVVSLLPYPVVRGTSPSSTGFLLDGTRVPLLYHLLGGPSVIHPEFIDEIQFFPGGAPAPYGGYTGGIIDGRTARARPDEHLLDFDANLLQVGGFVRQPLKPIGATVTAAGRYGYPGFLLGLATDEVSLSYWDYQLRLDGGNALDGWTVFFFGARDELDTVPPDADPTDPSPPLEPSLVLGFQRADLRLHQTFGDVEMTARAVLGYDRTLSMGTDFTLWSAEPALSVRWVASEGLTLSGGLLASVRSVSRGADALADPNALSGITANIDELTSGSTYLELLWRPAPGLLIRPGLRADVYSDETATQWDIDPRLTFRYALHNRDLPDVKPGSDDSAIWLKGSAGIYHQPPRFVLPLPGLDMMPLQYGLLRSYQTSLGTELPFANGIQLSLEGFLNLMDPTVFDLSVNDASVTTEANASLTPVSIVMPQTNQQEFIDRLTTPQTGSAYGLELLLRRQSKTGVFGWVSYTLSRAARSRGGAEAPYDFDRTHLLSLVAGLPLRRNWDIGLRFQYQSGKPTTVSAGYNAARGEGYMRIDLRVEKRFVISPSAWWAVVAEVMNASLSSEVVRRPCDPECRDEDVGPIVLPSLGVLGQF